MTEIGRIYHLFSSTCHLQHGTHETQFLVSEDILVFHKERDFIESFKNNDSESNI